LSVIVVTLETQIFLLLFWQGNGCYADILRMSLYVVFGEDTVQLNIKYK